MQDINTLLSKQYPESFLNKNLSLLDKQEIWSKSSNSLATISNFLPGTLCLWLLKHGVPNRVADEKKKVSHMFSDMPTALEQLNAFLQSPCTAARSKSTRCLFSSQFAQNHWIEQSFFCFVVVFFWKVSCSTYSRYVHTMAERRMRKLLQVSCTEKEITPTAVKKREKLKFKYTSLYFYPPLRICCTASFPICAAVKPCKEMMEGSEP